MNQMLSVPKRRMWLRAALAMIYALALSSSAAAGPSKIVRGEASGNITSQEFCSATELCQESTVAGQATQIGQFVGNLSERVDLLTGTYTGTGLFTTSTGDTLSTESKGNVTPPSPGGRVFFAEDHEIVGGTGRFAAATGEIHVVGTADADGNVRVWIVGSLSK
jgi:hypothetical protein